MEGKNALVYNHRLLHRLGGELKGKAISSVGVGLCYTQISASSGNKTTLTSLSPSQAMMDDNNNNDTVGGIYVPKKLTCFEYITKTFMCSNGVRLLNWGGFRPAGDEGRHLGIIKIAQTGVSVQKVILIKESISSTYAVLVSLTDEENGSNCQAAAC